MVFVKILKSYNAEKLNILSEKVSLDSGEVGDFFVNIFFILRGVSVNIFGPRRSL